MRQKILIAFFLFSLSAIFALPVQADTHTHFDSEVARLTGKGLLLSGSLRSEADINRFCSGSTDCSTVATDNVSYDPAEDAAKWAGGTRQLYLRWPAVKTGKVYIQYETRFSSMWSFINHEGGTVFQGAKFTRPRQDSIKTTEPRCFDFQIRMSGDVCRGTAGCPAGMPTIRVYAASPAEGADPLRDGVNYQPGGDTADFGSNYTAADHAIDNRHPFLYLPERWIRETYEVDLDAGRIKYWASDEFTNTKLVIADPSNPNLGFNFEPGTNFAGMDAINIGVNSSTPYPNPFPTYWHRNAIISTQPISLGSSTPSPGTPGDLNSDGKVDIFDYSLFISNFGKTGTGLAADLNSDGKVDIFDYSMFISNFGK